MSIGKPPVKGGDHKRFRQPVVAQRAPLAGSGPNAANWVASEGAEAHEVA
jgi:hypothetical protein